MSNNLKEDQITVAVWMVTYNHEDYISRAVESVMDQKTNFKYKLFIGEDYSTDNTREICLKLIIIYLAQASFSLYLYRLALIKNN